MLLARDMSAWLSCMSPGDESVNSAFSGRPYSLIIILAKHSMVVDIPVPTLNTLCDLSMPLRCHGYDIGLYNIGDIDKVA